MAIHLSPKAIALASLGTVGAGGVGAVGIAYSKGLMGSGESVETNGKESLGKTSAVDTPSGGHKSISQPAKKAKRRKSDSYESLHEIMKDDGDNVHLEQSSSPFQRDGVFNMETYGCAEAFFPEAQLPDMNSTPVAITTPPEPSTLLIDAPSGLKSNESEGCNIMLLQRKDKRFLLKIELALRNQDHGLLLGKAFKNVGDDNSLKVQYFQYAAFLGKTNGQWKIKSALSWGTKTGNELMSLTSMLIGLPDSNTESISHNEEKTENVGFSGIWNSKEGSSVPFMEIKNTYLENLVRSNFLSLSVTSLERPKDGVDTFFSGGDAGSDAWKRFNGDVEDLSSDKVIDHMGGWIQGLTNSVQGQWTPMKNYCQEDGDGHDGEICKSLLSD